MPKAELAVAHQALFATVQDQAEEETLYYFDSANYTHIFVGGRHIGAIKIDGNEELIKFLEKGIDNGTYRNTADINRWNESIGSRERYDNHSNASAPRQRGGNGGTDILYQGQQTDTERDWSQSIGDSGSTAQPLRARDGVVFGFAKGGKIYLTEQGLNPNTPIHEYTHLWAKALQQKNPAAWRSIVNLLKGTPMWDEVVNDPNYKDLTTDDEIASEVLSRYSGKNGAERFQREAKRILRDKSISAYARIVIRRKEKIPIWKGYTDDRVGRRVVRNGECKFDRYGQFWLLREW